MLDVDEDEKLTGEEEFELLAGPLGLSERRIVPEAVQFPDSDPLGASVAMVTATNSMEETLLQIGEEDSQHHLWNHFIIILWHFTPVLLICAYICTQVVRPQWIRVLQAG